MTERAIFSSTCWENLYPINLSSNAEEMTEIEIFISNAIEMSSLSYQFPVGLTGNAKFKCNASRKYQEVRTKTNICFSVLQNHTILVALHSIESIN